MDGGIPYITFPLYKRDMRDAMKIIGGPFPIRHTREILIQLASGIECQIPPLLCIHPLCADGFDISSFTQRRDHPLQYIPGSDING